MLCFRYLNGLYDTIAGIVRHCRLLTRTRYTVFQGRLVISDNIVMNSTTNDDVITSRYSMQSSVV